MLSIPFFICPQIKKKWTDLKARTREHVRKLNLEKAISSGGKSSVKPLNPFEERVLIILGTETLMMDGGVDTSIGMYKSHFTYSLNLICKVELVIITQISLMPLNRFVADITVHYH